MASRSNPGPFPHRPAAYASPYGAAPPAPAAKPNTTPLLIAGGVALLLLLVIGGVMMRMLSKPRGRASVGPVPANFFQQATADFAQAKQLLVDGRLTESTEKFAESQHFRSRAATQTITGGQTFEAWCAAREKEYRALAAEVAATFPGRVGKPGGPTLAEVDTFLAQYGTPGERTAWQRQRPGLERRSATAAADSAHRIEWVIQSLDTSATEDMNDDDRRPLQDAIAARMGNGTPLPLVPAASAPGVPPEQGVGFVRVTLEFLEAPYISEKTNKESEIKVPAAVKATQFLTEGFIGCPFEGTGGRRQQEKASRINNFTL